MHRVPNRLMNKKEEQEVIDWEKRFKDFLEAQEIDDRDQFSPGSK